MQREALLLILAILTASSAATAQAPHTPATPPAQTAPPAPARNATGCAPTQSMPQQGTITPQGTTATDPRAEPLGDKLARSDGVLCPPTGVDPEIRARAHQNTQRNSHVAQALGFVRLITMRPTPDGYGRPNMPVGFSASREQR